MSLLTAFLKQEVTIKPFIRQEAGEPIYGQETARKCRIERGANLKVVYKNPSGSIEEVTAIARLFCLGDPIPTRSVVTHNGIEYTVINCVVMTGFKDHHLEVYLAVRRTVQLNIVK